MPSTSRANGVSFKKIVPVVFRRWCDGPLLVLVLVLEEVVEDLEISLADEGTLRSEGTYSLTETVVALPSENFGRDWDDVGEKGAKASSSSTGCCAWCCTWILDSFILVRTFFSISSKNFKSFSRFFLRSCSSRAVMSSSGYTVLTCDLENNCGLRIRINRSSWMKYIK